MAKKNVVEVVCERCERTEYVDPDDYSHIPDLILQFGSKIAEVQPPPEPVGATPPLRVAETEVKFEDLCSSCKKTVRNLVAQISKKIDWRRGKSEAGEQVEVEVGS